MVQQQLLDLFNQSYEFTGFISTGNEIVVSALQDFVHQFTHIYGGHLAGKSHLLKAWVNLANQRAKQAIYLDAGQVQGSLSDLIDEDRDRFIAIDNVDSLSDQQQIQLFDLFNHIKLHDKGNYLLTSATLNLNNKSFREDLKTRIYSGVILNLKSLDDIELMNALTIYTKREGLKFGEAEIAYLLKYYTRNLGQLIALINKVGKFALIEKKNITIQLIKNCM